MMEQMKLILLVGYGSMGRRRIRLTKELFPDVKFICVDSNIARRNDAEKEGHIVVSSLDKGIEMSPDVAFVCTSPGHHADIILKLVAAQIHVFTELNLTSDRYEQISEQAEKNGVVVFPSSTLVYKRQMKYFREAVLKLDKPTAYNYHVGQYLPDWHPWESYKDFFIGHKETNGIREILAIQLPWIIRTFGQVESVHVLNQNCTKLDIDFPDCVILSIVHKNGCIGSFVVDVTSRKAVTRLEIIGEDIHIIWDGHNDDLYQYNLDTKTMEQVSVYDSEQHVSGYSDTIAEEPYQDEINEFMKAIQGEDVLYNLKDDSYVLGVIDEIEGQYKQQRRF